MNDRFYERREQVTDRYLQSSYSLWSAILTVNGIILAMFSSVRTSDNTSSNFAVIITMILSLVSLILIVYNFMAAKQIYYRISEVMADETAQVTPEQQRRDIKQALSRNRQIVFNEKVCLFLLLFEAALVVFIVAYPWLTQICSLLKRQLDFRHSLNFM